MGPAMVPEPFSGQGKSAITGLLLTHTQQEPWLLVICKPHFGVPVSALIDDEMFHQEVDCLIPAILIKLKLFYYLLICVCVCMHVCVHVCVCVLCTCLHSTEETTGGF